MEEDQMDIDSSDINETDDEVYSSGNSGHEDNWSQDIPSQSNSEEDEPIVVQLEDSSDQSMENPTSDDEADESEEDDEGRSIDFDASR
jgi:hypothetical protein